MSWPRVFAARMRCLFLRSRLDGELEDELRFHLEMQAEDNARKGMQPREARYAAMLQFGGIESTKEEYRERRSFTMIETFFRDIRYAGRTLRNSPGFAAVVIASLALGIGATTAIFGLADQILLHPTGIVRPDRIVALQEKYEKFNLKDIPLSAPNFADVRDSRAIFAHAGAMRVIDLNFTGGDVPQRLRAAAVSSEWFDVFGAKPVLGRVFSPEEDRPNANRVVVLSHAAWVRLFGADPTVAGRKIELNRQPYRIIGVMAAGFDWPNPTDIWVPLALPPPAFAQTNRFNENLVVVALRRPGVSFARANSWLGVLTARVFNSRTPGASAAKNAGYAMYCVPFLDFNAGDTKKPVLILLGGVVLVLLIACSNCAGLTLARASKRAQEMALRGALGASRARLVGQTLTESLLLACAGAVAGLAVAWGATFLLLRLAPRDVVSGIDARLNIPMLAFTAAVALVSGIVFGIAPAWHLSRIDPHDALKGSERSTTAGTARQRLRSIVVVAETALALILLAGAGLFLRSFEQLQNVNPGFDPRGVMAATFSLPQSRYPDGAAQSLFYRSLLDRLAAARGVAAAAVGFPGPFCDCLDAGGFVLEGHEPGPGDPGSHADRRYVTPEYFRALAIPLKRGQTFTETDRLETRPVAVVDEELARHYWPAENPIGKRIRLTDGTKDWYTVVGVVGHVLSSDLAADSGRGSIYFDLYQIRAALPNAWIIAKTPVTKTPGSSASIAGAIREAVRSADPAEPLYNLGPLEDRVSESLAPRRFVLRLLGFFAITALFMAALGLYGVVSYSVSLRTREIGIRMALGAGKGSVLRTVLYQGLRLTAIGVAAGLAGSLLTNRVLKSQLFEVSAFDPLIFASAAAALLAAAAFASYLPARRAVRVDPMGALRSE